MVMEPGSAGLIPTGSFRGRRSRSTGDLRVRTCDGRWSARLFPCSSLSGPCGRVGQGASGRGRWRMQCGEQSGEAVLTGPESGQDGFTRTGPGRPHRSAGRATGPGPPRGSGFPSSNAAKAVAGPVAGPWEDLTDEVPRRSGRMEAAEPDLRELPGALGPDRVVGPVLSLGSGPGGPRRSSRTEPAGPGTRVRLPDTVAPVRRPAGPGGPAGPAAGRPPAAGPATARPVGSPGRHAVETGYRPAGRSHRHHTGPVLPGEGSYA